MSDAAHDCPICGDLCFCDNGAAFCAHQCATRTRYDVDDDEGGWAVHRPEDDWDEEDEL